MKKIFTFIFILFFSFEANANQDIIWWNTNQARNLLEKSEYKNDFYQLVNFYQAQINPLYCGVATSVMILNALEYGEIESQKEIEVTKPSEMGGGVMEYKIYSQTNFLNQKTDKIKDHQVIELKKALVVKNGETKYDPGFSLNDIADMLSDVYKLKVTKVFAEDNNEKSVKKFREILKKYLNEDKNFIVVNFNGKVAGTNTGGHISPVVAYDEASDMVLVMDAALHKNRWYFISVKKLYEAMNTKDGEKYRGYLVVKK